MQRLTLAIKSSCLIGWQWSISCNEGSWTKITAIRSIALNLGAISQLSPVRKSYFQVYGITQPTFFSAVGVNYIRTIIHNVVFIDYIVYMIVKEWARLMKNFVYYIRAAGYVLLLNPVVMRQHNLPTQRHTAVQTHSNRRLLRPRVRSYIYSARVPSWNSRRSVALREIHCWLPF